MQNRFKYKGLSGFSKGIIILSGCSSISAGLIVLTGWIIGNPYLIKIYPAFIAMQPVTAINFILCGAAILSLLYNKRLLPRIIGAAIVLFSLFTLYNFFFSYHINLSRLTVRAPLSGIVVHLFRMSPNSAVNFIFSGTALFLLSIKLRLKERHFVLGILGSTVVAISIAGVIGYLTGISEVYTWGDKTGIGMALHTAFGFIFLGLGIMAFAWNDEWMEKAGSPRWFPTAVGLGILAITTSLSVALYKQEHSYISEIVKSTAHSIGDDITEDMRSRILAEMHSPLDEFVSFLGVITAGLFMLTIHLGQKARIKSNEVEIANQALRLEVEERIRLEQQLIHAQKMEAVGRLTGGIAHDFNNILTAMIGYVSLMQRNLKDENYLRGNLEKVLKLTEKAAHLVKGLLTFSRKEKGIPEPIDLNELMHESQKLLSRLIREDIEIEMPLSNEPLTIMADSGQLTQVIMNLLINAADAIEGKGVITISTGLRDINEQEVSLYEGAAAGRYAYLSVSDTGIGMDDGTIKKIFDPFFTTKEIGKGTGLGLSIVYGIVKQHNGFINIDSKPGGGTTFQVYFPIEKGGVLNK